MCYIICGINYGNEINLEQTMLSLKKIVLLCFMALIIPACTESGQKVAVINVQEIIGSGPNAEKAQAAIQEAQEIFQYNLNAIEKKLESYNNRELANAYLAEAARQLQAQMNTYRQVSLQNIANALNEIIEAEKVNYDIILNNADVLHVKDQFDITQKLITKLNAVSVTMPQLPQRIDDPNLPEESEIQQNETIPTE